MRRYIQGSGMPTLAKCNHYEDNVTAQSWDNTSLSSSPPSAAYIRQWIGSSLVQVMTCRMFGTKSLSEPIPVYCQLGTRFSDTWIGNISFLLKMHLKMCAKMAAILTRQRWVNPRGVEAEFFGHNLRITTATDDLDHWAIDTSAVNVLAMQCVVRGMVSTICPISLMIRDRVCKSTLLCHQYNQHKTSQVNSRHSAECHVFFQFIRLPRFIGFFREYMTSPQW